MFFYCAWSKNIFVKNRSHHPLLARMLDISPFPLNLTKEQREKRYRHQAYSLAGRWWLSSEAERQRHLLLTQNRERVIWISFSGALLLFIFF